MTPRHVVLSITGAAQAAGQLPDEIHLVTTGLLTPLKEGFQLDYQESQPDGSEVQDIRLLMERRRVTMTRTGDYGATMVFEKGRRFESLYHTPYGDMEMAVFPTRVSVSLGEEQGNVHLQYQLDFQGQFASVNDLTVQYRQSASRRPS